jgi:hypothetical protein
MKYLFSLIFLLFASVSGFAQINFTAVMVDTNGVVQRPTNFSTVVSNSFFGSNNVPVTANTNGVVAQPTNFSTANNITRSISRVKPSNTSISNSNTFTADPHLQISNLPVGRWRVELSIQVYDNNAAGFKWQFAGTSSNAVSARGRGVGISSSTFGWQSFTTPLSGENVSPWINSTRVALIWFEINTTTAGSFNLEWAQNTSNAQVTTLNGGSYLQLISLD